MPYLSADPPLTPRDLFGITRLPGAARSSGGWVPERSRFLGSGRAALWGALHALGVGLGDEVLLPSFLCESVVSPVVARRAEPRFFPVGRGLRPDLAALDAAVGPRTRAVVLIHYFGFPGPVEEVRQLCESRGVALIEDCAHALFGRLGDRPLGTFGAAAIFSPWKSLPLPDGGLLSLNRAELRFDGPLAAPSRAATARRVAYRSVGSLEALVGWSPRLALLRRNGLRRALHDRVSGAPVSVRAGSSLSWRLLRSAPAERIVARRRENYLRLLDPARRLSWAEPLFDDLPPGVCPLGLPLVAEERDRWRDALLAKGVNVRTYWEHLPVEVDANRFEAAAWLRDRILVLPVHQGLRSDQVDWLAAKLSAIGGQRSASRRAKADR
jgi:perosamine synthetase